MRGVDEHERPDHAVNCAVVAAETEEEDEHRGLYQGEDWVVAELLEEVPPEAGAGVEIFRDFGVFPAVVVELEDCCCQLDDQTRKVNRTYT